VAVPEAVVVPEPLLPVAVMTPVVNEVLTLMLLIAPLAVLDSKIVYFTVSLQAAETLSLYVVWFCDSLRTWYIPAPVEKLPGLSARTGAAKANIGTTAKPAAILETLDIVVSPYM
jgi:hypothetical protein